MFPSMHDWQSMAAAGVVAITILVLARTFWRRMHKPPAGGCAGDCGCAKTELRVKQQP